MAKESESVKVMKENFMELHGQGLSIPEIAEKFGISSSVIYKKHLQEIADANGVSRESLLKIVREPTERMYKEEEKRVKVNIEELKRGFREAGEKIDFLIGIIDDILEEEKKYDGYEI